MPTDIMNAVRMQPMHHSPVLPLRLLTRGPDYLRRQIDTGTPRSSLSAVERLAADKAKYVKSQQQQQVVSGTGSTASESSSSAGGSSEQPVRRGSSKRLLRPDSLLIYRHKNRADGAAEEARTGLVRRLFLGSVKEKVAAPPGESAPDGRCPRSGLHRSQSDISSRYSRSFSDFDTFFKYCGLEPEVVDELGRDRFSSSAPANAPEDSLDGQYRLRSASVATSDSGFSRRSADGGNDGLQEDEPLSGHIPGVGGTTANTTSVIERNARIIKWLYSCKRAKESRGASPDLP